MIFIDKQIQMADNFNLKGYLKKNTLLNENIGGYVDLKPVKEEMGTAMGENDTEEGEISRIEGLVNQAELVKFAEAAMAIAQDLGKEGFDQEDVKQFLIDKLNDMILA